MHHVIHEPARMPASGTNFPCNPINQLIGSHSLIFGCAGASARAGEAYQLSDLQDHISRYPPEHYGGGRDPLPYAFVLLLTVQPKALTAFLAKHPSASAYRTDAVHLAIALLHHKVGCPAQLSFVSLRNRLLPATVATL